MISTADALVIVADSILDKISQLGPVEITKKGRKYKFINNTFQRIQKEDKHLIINPDNLDKRFAVLLAYRILHGISPAILSEFRDLSLVIIGVAQELEKNGWYEEENSSVINYKQLKFVYVDETARSAFEFARHVTPRHLEIGFNLLYCSKLNFFHTDHHIGTRLEGLHMRNYVEEYFGPGSLELPEVLTALKSFVHWGNIKGLLYKLDVPNMELNDEFKLRYSLLPDPPQLLKDYVYARPPSGTSKYFLVRKALNCIMDSPYSQLIPYPQDLESMEPKSIYKLCHDIQKDPVSYHLRADVKLLAACSVNLSDLSQKYEKNVKVLLQVIGMIINTFPNEGFEPLMQHSKVPKLTDQPQETHKEYFTQLVTIHERITDYEEKGWALDDIVSRLKCEEESMYDRISSLRAEYPEDPRTDLQ